MLKQLFSKYKRKKYITKRAWVEINTECLARNLKKIQLLLAQDSEIMAVLKPDSYGDADLIIAKTLNRFGVRMYAVETLADAVRMRKNRIKGEILILNETELSSLEKLVRYKLTQTVTSIEYAKLLNKAGKNLCVHIQMAAGIEQPGLPESKLSTVKKIYKMKNLQVKGIFAYLSDEKSNELEDIMVSELEIEDFFRVISSLKEAGIEVGKTHLQSCYGLMHYPHVQCDYTRVGSVLYGLCSTENDALTAKLKLEPVISMKARISMIRHLEKNEYFSYGDSFIADREMQIAVVSIGYANGIPKRFATGDSHLLLHGKKVPIIGKVCMNQLLVDISKVAGVKPGDVVTVIGSEGNRKISLEDIAYGTGDIAEDILDRFLCSFHQGIISTKKM